MSQPERFIRIKEVQSLIGLSRASIYRLEQSDPSFPRRLKLGQRAVAWRVSALKEWMNSREHIV